MRTKHRALATIKLTSEYTLATSSRVLLLRTSHCHEVRLKTHDSNETGALILGALMTSLTVKEVESKSICLSGKCRMAPKSVCYYTL